MQTEFPPRRIQLTNKIFVDITSDKIIKEGKESLMFNMKFPYNGVNDLVLLELIDEGINNPNEKSIPLMMFCANEWMKKYNVSMLMTMNFLAKFFPKDEIKPNSFFFKYFKEAYKNQIIKTLGHTAAIYSYKKFSKTIYENVIMKAKAEGYISDTNGCDDSNIFDIVPVKVNLGLTDAIEIIYDVVKRPRNYIPYQDEENFYF